MKFPHACTLALLLSVVLKPATAQLLFSYGSNNITRDEFRRAFLKNNTDKQPSEKAFRDYLDLYTRFKLKVKAAYDLQLDTLPSQKAELENFRQQIAGGYLHDERSYQALVDEAFRRSQKDVHLAHIFIPLSGLAGTNGSLPEDTSKAWRRAMAAYEELKNGIAFADVADRYSADSSVRMNHGDIGYITVFTLPYNLETLAYSTPSGSFSKPFRTSMGYHIFKNMGARKALGKIKAAQILVGFPPDAPAGVKLVIKQLADSVYKALLAGASFSEMARQFSRDNSSYLNNGELPAFGVGTFDPEFEREVFSLQENGSLSRPILTIQGYHIVKRLSLIPVNTDPRNDSAMAVLKQQVLSDPRIEVSKKMMIQKISALTGFKQVLVPDNKLWAFADSSLSGKQPLKTGSLSLKTPLFTFPGQQIFLEEWINTLQPNRSNPAGINNRLYDQLYASFRDAKILEYYGEHLERYNPEFAALMREFKEGNLLFEIMQRQVWDKASADSSGLKTYYNNNKSKYLWESSVNAVIFNCTDLLVANELRRSLQTGKKDWQSTMAPFQDKVTADSGRFEVAQLPLKQHEPLQEGMLTLPFRNAADSNVTFVYVVKTYPGKLPRSFEDARGFVLNDYQAYLEENWIKTLKAKYPVKVNEAVLQSLWKP